MRACAVPCCSCNGRTRNARVSAKPSFPLFFHFFPYFSLSLFLSRSPVPPASSSLSFVSSLCFYSRPCSTRMPGCACLRGAALATLARSARCQLVATHLPSRLSRHRPSMRERESDRSYAMRADGMSRKTCDRCRTLARGPRREFLLDRPRCKWNSKNRGPTASYNFCSSITIRIL